MIRLIGIFALLISSITFSACSGTIEVPFTKDGMITDQDAVNLSRQALQQSGKDITRYAPVSHKHDEIAYFAKAPSDTEMGYVLWRDETQGKGAWDYMVNLERRDEIVNCKITKAH